MCAITVVRAYSAWMWRATFCTVSLIPDSLKLRRSTHLRCVHCFDRDVWPRHRPKRLRDAVDAGPDQNQRDEYLMSAGTPFTLAVSCSLPSNLLARHRVFPPADVQCPTRAAAQESRMLRRSLASRCTPTQRSSSSRDVLTRAAKATHNANKFHLDACEDLAACSPRPQAAPTSSAARIKMNSEKDVWYRNDERPRRFVPRVPITAVSSLRRGVDVSLVDGVGGR